MGNSMDPVHIEHTADTTHVALEAALGIADAQTLYARLDSALTGGTPIVVDGTRVERLDAAALQVLVCFCHTARQRGLALSWQNVSPELQQAARLLGLETALQLTP
jgi:anti-anti-sigma factor